MRYFSIFSGVGGFELGMPTGWDCIGFSEIDSYASSVLRYHFPDIKNYGDIAKIDWSAVPDFDLLVGGSPCQDFSVAGKRAGITGKRSGLFDEYVRALTEKCPDSFIWENVKGVMSSGGGWDFARILTAFSEAGYSLWWQVLNAKNFGVPQNRERVFVVGSRNRSPREVFFEREADTKGLVEITQNAPDAERVYDPNGIGRTLKGLGGGEGAKTMLIPVTRGRSDEDWKKGSVAPSRRLGDKEDIRIIRCPLRYLDRNQKNIEGDYAFTVDASQTAGVTDGVRVRRLTPKEAERLMSWPDDWTQLGRDGDGNVVKVSDAQRYKMCGNGVVSEVVRQLVKNHF